MSEKKKKIFGPIELFAFLATVGILAFIGLKQGGGNIMERTEQVEIIDNSSHVGGEKKRRKYQTTEEESVEAILQQLADQYSGEKVAQNPKKQLEKVGMSEDEIGFLEDVKEKKIHKNDDPSVDWFSILQASHKTYTSVKSVFEKAGIDVEAAEGNVTSKLVNEVAARTLYSKMEEVFKIPEEDTRAFAQRGEKALSDWARFVEEKKQ